MLVVSVELLHGTIRAGSADDLAGTGAGGDEGEWPPSPARLVSAFVAADGTRDRMRATSGVELDLLERAGAPTIVCSPDDGAGVLRSALLERFVVVDRAAKNTTQDYPARSAEGVRMSARMCPREPVITYVWPEVVASEAEMAGLRARAARIGYFGCADSPARVQVSTDAVSPEVSAGRTWTPDPGGQVVLPTVEPGFVAQLDGLFDAFTAGQWVRRAWVPTRRTTYRTPTPPPAAVACGVGPTMWLELSRTVSGRHVLRVTDRLRQAVFTHLQDVLGPEARLPTVITGHNGPVDGWEQAMFLALPHVGVPHATGRIAGAAVCLPATAATDVVEAVRDAVSRIRHLNMGQGLSIGVNPSRCSAGPRASDPARWSTPARRFASAFPVVHERFRKGGPVFDDAVAWCRHASLPDPVAVCFDRLPLLAGAVQLRAHEASRTGRPSTPHGHVIVEFAEPVRGPVVLGRARTFGLGLLAPVGQAGG